MSLYKINHTLGRILCSCILLCLSTQTLIAQVANSHEFTISSDNDAYLFINQDQYYTNGIRFSYRKLRDAKYLRDKQVKTIWELAIGHKLYNAYSGSVEWGLIDRPFTAYLYASGKNTWFYKDESSFSMAVEVGLYGKGAFGEQIQEGFHHLFGFYEINGWEYQLKSNATLDIRADYNRLLLRVPSQKLDVQLLSKISAGLNQSYLGIGPALRIGKMNKLFESVFFKSRLNISSSHVEAERYFYYRPMLFYRLYDASIQGGMLLHEKGPITFEIKPWVFSQSIGFAYAKRHFSLDVHLQFDTKEVRSTATGHQYGTISLGYAF